MFIKNTFSTVVLVIGLLLSVNQSVARQSFPTHLPEVWYMDMNDRDKPNLFVKSVGVGDTVLVLHGGFGTEYSCLLDLVESLADEYHFVLFDQRGSLRSPVADIPENIFPSWHDYNAELPRLEVHDIEKAGHTPWIDQPDEVHRILLLALFREYAKF